MTIIGTTIVGLGTDLLRIERIARLGARHGTMLLDRLLAPQERQALGGRGERAADWPLCAPDIASLAAAKEAFFKALGTGLVAPLRWADVTVQRAGLALAGASAAAFAALGGTRSSLSLTRADGFVLATVLLLGPPHSKQGIGTR
jgi:holo-[acyl-carrier protein] synthase